jgi:hypothetical protein
VTFDPDWEEGLHRVPWLLRVIPIQYNTAMGTGAVLFGYSIYETTGSATAQLNIYNGRDNTGLLVLPIVLAKSQGAEDWFGPSGIHMSVGIYPSVISGSVNGSLFVHLPFGD